METFSPSSSCFFCLFFFLLRKRWKAHRRKRGVNTGQKERGSKCYLDLIQRPFYIFCCSFCEMERRKHTKKRISGGKWGKHCLRAKLLLRDFPACLCMRILGALVCWYYIIIKWFTAKNGPRRKTQVE